METIFFGFLATRSSFSVSNFSTNASFRVVKTDFWLVQTIFYIFFSETPAGESFFFCLVDIYFWTNPSFRLSEKDISLIWKDRSFTWKFFSTSGNRHCYEWKPIFKDRTYSCWWKLIFWLVETIFFHGVIYFSRSPSLQ